MSAQRRRVNIDPTASSGSSPMLWLLLGVVLVPTVCVLWFMNEVTQNEHLAVREQLTKAYRSNLPLLQEHLQARFAESVEGVDELARSIDQAPSELSAAAVFYRTVTGGLADSLVCYDAEGQLAYPRVAPSTQADADATDGGWAEATQLEYVQQDFTAAANAYASLATDALAEQPPRVNLAARALQAQARSLFRGGEPQQAIDILRGIVEEPRFAAATDPEGRLIVADAALRALELRLEVAGEADPQQVESVNQKLADYTDRKMSSSQRLFLMKRLQSMFPQQVDFPTLPAEELAQLFLDARAAPVAADVLQRTSLPGVWQMATPSRQAVLLIKTDQLTQRMQEWVAAQGLLPNVTVQVLSPTAEESSGNVIGAIGLGAQLPGWRVTLSTADDDTFQSATNRRITVYLWIGMLVIATTTVLAVLIARAIRRQSQLTKLKNDLVATISHELKTPLASMRLLVDTLLDAPNWNEDQVREYLELISKENTRLSRLIDNFLAFSRIERNKYTFDFSKLSVADIIQESVESVQERFQSPDCQFDVHVDVELPAVMGDRDALVTVVLNLLDNAYKYSGENKAIVLNAFADQDQICIEVRDNGVGLSPRDTKRIFKRFYQADQRLSRTGGGCGLGLSIVQYIVDAHRGSIHVVSEPGAGSRFVVRLPAATSAEPVAKESVA